MFFAELILVSAERTRVHILFFMLGGMSAAATDIPASLHWADVVQ